MFDFANEQAEQTFAKILEHPSRVAAAFGEKSEEAGKTALSLTRVLTVVNRLGGKLWADSPLSLYGVNEHISYGVVFFRDKNFDEVLEQNYFLRDEDDTYPQPGEWSVHS